MHYITSTDMHIYWFMWCRR